MAYQLATRATFYFIGVTTGQSSIMRVFPAWARHWGLDAVIEGMDFVPHDKPERYRDAIQFLKQDPLSRGALVTTHKLDLFKACQDLFDWIDSHADLMEETSCLSKQGDQLRCHAKDPITAGLSMDAILPDDHFAQSGAELFSMGAGGSTIALTWHAAFARRGTSGDHDRPSRIIVSDPSAERLAHIEAIHQRMGMPIAVDYQLVRSHDDNDAILADLKPGSFTVNATGLGKDRPGSPLGDMARFPEGGFVWELNYRGDLVFLDQAKSQSQTRGLTVADGWTYFIHGWTQVIAEVFALDLPVSGPHFDALAKIAADVTGRTQVH